MTPTWTLLLIGPRYLSSAVVVGGYLSAGAADQAGRYACDQVSSDRDGVDLDGGLSVITRYIVIPGPPLVDPLIITNPAAPHLSADDLHAMVHRRG